MKFFKNVMNYFSIIDMVFCIFLGIAFSIYPEYYKNGDCIISLQLVIKSIVLTFTFLISCIIIRVLINKINGINDNNNSLISRMFNKDNKTYKYRLFIIAGIIFLLWLPVLISLFPGTASNDTWGQLNQFIACRYIKGYLNDRHPVFDTIYMGTILLSIVKLSGNWHLAFFTYVIIQAIITSLVFSYSIIYAKEKLKLNNFFILLFLFVYAILPIYPASVQAINKDALFSWIYVLLFINYIEIIRTNGEQLKSKKFFVSTIVLTVLCCLTKKVGMYVLILSFVFLLFFKILNKKRIIYIVTSIFIIMMVIMPIIFKVFTIPKGGAQEKYSLFFQQTARYLKYNMEDVTEDDKKLIEEVIGKDVNKIANVYSYTFADPVKGYSQQTKDINYLKYLFVWMKQGLKHPETYVDAANCMFSGWISFKMYKPLMNMAWHSQLNPYFIDESVTERTCSAKLAEKIQLIYDRIYNIPIIKYWLTPGMYTTVIPLFALATILRKKEKNKYYWLALMPLFLSIFLGCFLAPASDNCEGQRYLYPVTYTFVTVIMWTAFVENEKNDI